MSRSSLRPWPVLAGLLVVVLAACSEAPPPASQQTAKGPPPPPTIDQLMAATVSGVLDQPVTLANGAYQGPPNPAGAATRATLTLWAPTVVFADLDGQPGNEAVAAMAAETGGSGVFVHVGVFGVQGGKAVSLATALVGDRVQLTRLWVEHGQVHLDVVEPGPKDPACCPTQLARKVYAFGPGALKPVSSDAVGVLSVNLLSATDWVLAQLDGQPVTAAKPPTLLVQYGKVVGFSGCNRYTGALKETSAGSIAVGPLATTKMACDPASSELESRFVERMNAVRGYSFLGGQLALRWENKQEHGVLLFAR